MDISDILSSVLGGADVADPSSLTGNFVDAGNAASDSLSGLPDELKQLVGGDQGANELTKLLTQQNMGADGDILNTHSPFQPTDHSRPITGIDWVDKLLTNAADNFEKNPMSVIGGAASILGKLYNMKQGNGSPGQGQMANLVAQHSASSGGGPLQAAAWKAPTAMPLTQVVAPQSIPVYRGPLTDTFYRGKK